MIKFGKSVIILEHGSIEIDIVDRGSSYQIQPMLEYDVEYNRPDIGYYKFKSFESLEDAYNFYLKCDLNMKGV